MIKKVLWIYFLNIQKQIRISNQNINLIVKFNKEHKWSKTYNIDKGWERCGKNFNMLIEESMLKEGITKEEKYKLIDNFINGFIKILHKMHIRVNIQLNLRTEHDSSIIHK